MKNTIILMLFPGIRPKQADFGDKYLINDISLIKYKTKQVPYSEEEIKKISEDWDSTPHLMSGDSYASRFRNSVHVVDNLEYPNNLVASIKEKIGTVDFIFIDYSPIARALLERLNIEGIKVCSAMLDESLYAEYVGRLYLDGCNQYQILSATQLWSYDCEYLKKISDATFVFHSNEYLDGVDKLSEVRDFCYEKNAVNKGASLAKDDTEEDISK